MAGIKEKPIGLSLSVLVETELKLKYFRNSYALWFGHHTCVATLQYFVWIDCLNPFVLACG